jgi:hypothetical protein
MVAINNNWEALQYVQYQTDDVCMRAVSINGNALQYVRKQTDIICCAATDNNIAAIIHVRNPVTEKFLRQIANERGGI